MTSKTLADWLDTDSDDSSPRPLRRKSSGAYAAVFADPDGGGGATRKHSKRKTSITRSPNAPSLSSDSPVGVMRSSSRNSIRRSSSRNSFLGISGPIRGDSIGTPPPPEVSSAPLSALDLNKMKKQQEAEERRRRMEEMKAKLRETLGEAAAEKIAGEKNNAAAPATNENTNADTQANVGMPMPSHLPPLSARSSTDFGRRGSHTNGFQGSGSSPHHNYHQPPLGSTYSPNRGLQADGLTPPPARHVVVETEVMLADRGTQTACEIEVQTDPDPLVASCPQCYHEVYGHTHQNFYSCGHAGSSGVMLAAMSHAHGGGGGGMAGIGMGGDPVFTKLLANRMHTYNPYSNGGGGGGGYYQQPPPAVMASPTTFGTMGGSALSDQHWREQLSFIESSVDMLIKRYNLPPPPGMERFAPK